MRLSRSSITIAVAATVLGLGSAGSSAVAVATSGTDPLGCADQVFDPSDIATSTLDETAATTAEVLGVDLHVRIEGSLDGDIDGREASLEAGCPGWLGSDGLRAENLLVVMVSPSERQTSIYYGSRYASELIPADPQIQEFVMNPRFQAGDTEQGLIDGLDAIVVAARGGGVPQASEPAYDGSSFSIPESEYFGDSSSSSSSSNGVPPAVIFAFVILLVVIIAASSWAKANGWDSSSSSGYRRSYSSRRSFSSGSRSRSSSSRSSSRSSHRSGGGSSSKW